VQEREIAIKIYLKGLNQNKKHFRDMEANIPQVIVEAPYEDDDAADDGYTMDNAESLPVAANTGRRASMVSQTAINNAARGSVTGKKKSGAIEEEEE
jgi:hypothetical protein